MKFFFGVVLVSSFLRGRNGSKEKQERKEDGGVIILYKITYLL